MSNESYNPTKFDPYEYQNRITTISTVEEASQPVKDEEAQNELLKLCDFKLKDVTHFDVIF
jgi:hypothetical protein